MKKKSTRIKKLEHRVGRLEEQNEILLARLMELGGLSGSGSISEALEARLILAEYALANHFLEDNK